jgi:hypothetical protein
VVNLLVNGRPHLPQTACLPACWIPPVAQSACHDADYEWDAFGLPDLRSDWYVRRLRIEHSQIDDVASDPGRALAGHPGKVLRTFEIENMSRRDDDRDSTIKAWYLLDLAPVQPS